MSTVSRRSFVTGAGLGVAAGVGALAQGLSVPLSHAASPEPRGGMIASGYEDITADPLAYLSHITVLADFPIRIDTDTTWAQGVSINEADGEIYVANQRTGGTYLRIDVRALDGTYVSSRTIPIAAGAYTEALPWFRNSGGDLCFIVRTQNAETYAIYNYTADTLGSPIAIHGKAKADVDGELFITSDVWLNDISRIHVYDWASVRAGTPELLHTVVLDSAQPLFEKSQGIVANGGYYFVIQGGDDGRPSMSVYNAAGRLLTALAYNRTSFANALNEQSPGLVTDPTSYRYENEAGCTYQGKLVTLEVVNSHPTDNFQARCVLVVHNEISGSRVQTDLAAASHDTGWQEIPLRSGIVSYAGDTTPRWRRIGNLIYLNGAVKGLTATPSSTPVGDVPLLGRPDRNIQWTAPSSNGSQSNWQLSSAGVLSIISTTLPSTGTGSWFPFASSFAR